MSNPVKMPDMKIKTKIGHLMHEIHVIAKRGDYHFGFGMNDEGIGLLVKTKRCASASSTERYAYTLVEGWDIPLRQHGETSRPVAACLQEFCKRYSLDAAYVKAVTPMINHLLRSAPATEPMVELWVPDEVEEDDPGKYIHPPVLTTDQ